MNKRKWILLTALVSAALLIIGIILLIPILIPTIPLDHAAQMYTDALSAISTAQDMTLSISETREMSVGNQLFTESSQQKLTCSGIGTNDFRASVAETLSIGDYSVTFQETFSDNTGYVSVNDTGFICSINAEDYTKRFAPAQLLDPALYGSITGFDNRQEYVINFAQPSCAERWASVENYDLIDAGGTAYVSYDGRLTKSIYTLTYRLEDTQIKLAYTVDLDLSTSKIILPENTDSFITIDYIDGPKMLECASGYLLQANNLSSHYIDSIYFQAFGDSRTQEITLCAVNGERFSAMVKTSTTLKNETRVGQDSQLTKEEQFANDQYTVSTDGGEPAINSDITADDMYRYCQNRLISTIMLPEHIANVQFLSSEEALRIQYSGNDAFAMLISANACQSLYQEAQLLNDLAQSRTTDILQCYLEFDPVSGFPVASGITYNGTHNIEGMPYTLRYDAEQTYDLACGDTTE